MNNIWQEILLTAITAFIGALATGLIYFIKAKINQVKERTDSDLAYKYLDMITETIEKCVITTNQTYVNNLKAENLFDKEAQIEAFNKTKDAVLALLSEEAKKYIAETTNDSDKFLEVLIETAVNKNKEDIISA